VDYAIASLLEGVRGFMSNIPVAFVVLAAFFFLYFVAALWRSRPMGSTAERERHLWQVWITRIRRAMRV
jgi:hypothetical protein